MNTNELNFTFKDGRRKIKIIYNENIFRVAMDHPNFFLFVDMRFQIVVDVNIDRKSEKVAETRCYHNHNE